MGRKHKNASQRVGAPVRSLGLAAASRRMPSLVLDTSGMQPWQHAVCLGAAMWARTHHSVSLAVSDDPYGVWQACRFYLTAQRGVKPDFSYQVMRVVRSEMARAVWSLSMQRGLSKQMAESAVNEIQVLPYMLCVFWGLVGRLVGSFNQIHSDLLFGFGSVRPVWLPDHKTMRACRQDEPFVLAEQGLCVRGSTVSVLYENPSDQPHRFAALAASKRCRAVICRSRDALSLGWANHNLCYQVVTSDTPAYEVLIHPSYHLGLSVDGSVDLPPSG